MHTNVLDAADFQQKCLRDIDLSQDKQMDKREKKDIDEKKERNWICMLDNFEYSASKL